MPEVVAVPTDPQWKYNVNLAMQITVMVLYSVLLVYVLHNTYRYLVLAKRYKVLTHALFYTFAVMLAIARIYQHASSFDYLTNYKLRFLNNLSDGFSVCIGISQVIVISELYYAMELLQAELMTMDRESLVAHHQTKNQKVRRVQLVAIGAIVFTVVELIIRAILKDYGVGECVFVLELFLVGTFMLYFTRKFTKLVEEVQRTLCINFQAEKSALQFSLGVFLFTYFLRALIKGLSIALHNAYGTLWLYPLYAEASVCIVQQVYDFLPLMIISHQHHTAFKGETREATSALLEQTANSRDYTQIRPFTDQTVVSLD